ncbi:MAG TPA: sugar ABC transporter substrate-binding protein [Streptosporangiaceae bacterium]
MVDTLDGEGTAMWNPGQQLERHRRHGRTTQAPGRPRGREARWRPLAVGAAGAALLLAAAACSSGGGGSSGSKNVITFGNWAAAESNTAPGIAAMIKKFEALHPGITVKSEPISYTDIDHQLVLEAKSGNTPDVAELQGQYTHDVAETGTLQPLNSYETSSWQSSIIPNELSAGTINGQKVAIPWTTGPFGLWYNKTVMKAAGLKPVPPTTWTQLLADCKVIHAKEPKVIDFGTDSTSREYGLDQNWPIMKNFGGVPFTGKTATADTAAMRSYLTFMHTIDKDGYTPEGQKGGYFRQPAASNQVAFTVDGPYVKGVVQATNHMSDSKFYSTWGVAKLPTATAGQQSVTTPSGHQLVMFKNASNKSAAWQFMNFLVTNQDAVLNYTIKYEGSVPPLAHPVGAVASALDNPISQSFIKNIIPTEITPGWGPYYSSVYLDVMAAIQQAMTTSAPVASIASGLQSKLQTDLGG